MIVYVTFKELAEELGMDRSHLRRYVIKHGFAPVMVRTMDSRNQLTLALTGDDAEAVRALRQSQGFNSTGIPTENGTGGMFYIIQVVPEFAPNRVKLGFATDAIARLSSHQTAAPTARLLKAWPCHRAWELCAITSMARTGCRLIASEVYECDSLEELAERGDAFFGLMPML